MSTFGHRYLDTSRYIKIGGGSPTQPYSESTLAHIWTFW